MRWKISFTGGGRKLNKISVGVTVVALCVVSTLPVSAANLVYFIPQQSNAIYCNTAEVEIWANATGFQGGQISLSYYATCANVTNCTISSTFTTSGWNHQLGEDYITFLGTGPLTGKYLICTLTIHCTNDTQEDCKTPLAFIQSGDRPSELYNQTGSIPATWINGTFQCGEFPPCLGTCCIDPLCNVTFALNMSCMDCKNLSKYWKPNRDSACFNGNATSNLCLESCPHCCDSVDNDYDGSIDYPHDGACTCGLDPSEVDPLPPIPELPTIFLFCAGLLTLTGYVLWKKRS